MRERARAMAAGAIACLLLGTATAGTYSIAKARELLGYEPAIDLKHGVQLTEAWLREKGRL